MKITRDSIYSGSRAIPTLKFEEDQTMTSYSGLVIFQKLFKDLLLPSRLEKQSKHRNVAKRNIKADC